MRDDPTCPAPRGAMHIRSPQRTRAVLRRAATLRPHGSGIAERSAFELIKRHQNWVLPHFACRLTLINNRWDYKSVMYDTRLVLI